MKIKNLFKLLSVVVLSSSLSSCYFINQGSSLLKYNFSARPLTEVASDTRTSNYTKERIKTVFEIKKFAVEHLGLKNNKTYTKYVELKDRNYLVNVVVGSKPDQLEAYQWSFPFFGSFPYKGFYNYKEAEEEESRLREKGYDTYIRTAGAFSTLGWFEDPLYSYMLNYSTEYLANLIIHEMTHETVFIKNNIQFNEEMASFVGDHGAVEFLKYKYGEKSKEYRNSFYMKEDNKVFSKYINQFHDEMDKMYKNSNLSKEEKMIEKKRIIKDYKYDKFKEVKKNFKIKGSYAWFPKQKLNNAVIMGFITYEQDASLYTKTFDKLGKDLPKTIRFFKELEKKSGAMPKQFLKDYLDEKVKVEL